MLNRFTIAGGWAHGYHSNSKYYWVNDIYDMVKELGNYQKDVSMRKRGAKQALEDFTKARIEFVATNAVVSVVALQRAPLIYPPLDSPKVLHLGFEFC